VRAVQGAGCFTAREAPPVGRSPTGGELPPPTVAHVLGEILIVEHGFKDEEAEPTHAVAPILRPMTCVSSRSSITRREGSGDHSMP
jgi:hypothetical protein